MRLTPFKRVAAHVRPGRTLQFRMKDAGAGGPPVAPVGERLARMRSRSRRGALALAGLLVLALLVRLAVVERSLWLDELITVYRAEQSREELLRGLADDVHPPLFYLQLREWIAVFGTSELAVRGLSIAWSLAAVPAVWGWSRIAFPTRNPLAAAAVAAVGPFAVWYATEARMYPQVLALTAIAGLLGWKVLEDGPTRARAAGLLAALCALMYTHYFGVLFVAALGLLALTLAVVDRAKRRAGAYVVASCALAVGSLTPWLWWVVSHRTETPNPTIYAPPDIFSVLLVGLQMVIGFHSFELLGLLAAAWPALCLLALVLLPRVHGLDWRVGGVLLLVALPVLSLMLASLVGPRTVFDVRFLMVSAAPLYVLLGALWPSPGSTRGWVSTRVRMGLAGALSALAVWVAIGQASDLSNPKLYDYRGAIATVNDRAQGGDAVLLLPQFNAVGQLGSGEDSVLRYYRLRPELRGVKNADVSGQVPTRRTLERLWGRVTVTEPRRLFVLYTFEDQSAAGNISRAYRASISSRAREISAVEFANITVREYAVGEEPG